jgi:hypothetical protein
VKKLFVVLVMVGVSMCGSGVNAQTAPAQENNPHVISSQDLDLLRKDIRSKKKQLVAANLKLTDSEPTTTRSLHWFRIARTTGGK